jgi:hypothetical protein
MFAGRHSRYRSKASPTSCGRGNRTWYRPFPVTCKVPLFQSMSLRRRRATSPERNPNRANMSKIARSRSCPESVPSRAAISRSTSSADKQRGNLESRQWATAGIARARSSWDSPRKLRNLRNARREESVFGSWEFHYGRLAPKGSLEAPEHSIGRHPLPAFGVDLWPRGRIAVESVLSRHDGFETSRRSRSQEPERRASPELVQSSRFRTRRGVGGKASLQKRE